MSQNKRRQRKVRWDRVLILLIVLLVVVIAVAGATVYAYLQFARTAPVTQVVQAVEPPVETLNNRVNILLLGLDDAQPDQTARRSDTIMVASLNPQDGEVSLLSLPRDTKVNI
ncbi:MAG: LCP family protein, partial [Sporomusa sp.]